MTLKKLSEITIEKTERNHNLESLPVWSVTSEKGIIRSEEYFKKKVFSKNLSNYRILDIDDIAYNPSRINVGSIALNDKEKGLISPLYVIIKCDNDEINPEFLINYLKSDEGVNQIKHKTEGSVRDSLSYSNLGRIELILPKINIQDKIVEIIKKSREIETKRKEIIVTIDKCIESFFYKLFGLANEMKFELTPLNKLIIGEPQNGFFKKDEFYGSGTKIAWVENITDCFLETSNLKKVRVTDREKKQYLVENGDILVTRSSHLGPDGVGVITLIDDNNEEIIFESHIVKIKLNNELVNPFFLMAFFRTEFGRSLITKNAKKSTMTSISQPDLLSLKIPLPSMNKQKLIEPQIRKLEHIKRNQIKTLQNSQELIKSLIYNLTTGRHNVKE
jgi:type I restriction enzyme, S subunit